MQPTRKRKYARRDQRKQILDRLRLNERDVSILLAVHQYRVLSSSQIARLFFHSLPRAYKRLNKLYHHKLLDRRFLALYTDKMHTPILYVLDKEGAEELQKNGVEISWSKKHKEIGSLFLQHTLAVNDVRIAVTQASQATHTKLVRWLSESELKSDYDRVYLSGIKKAKAVIPDGYFALRTSRGITHFFLEVDQGTERSKVYRQKIRAYLAYFQSAAATQRFGTQRFRVLTVTTSKKRAENLRQYAQAEQGKSRFWFTTLEQVTSEKILTAPIWTVADRDQVTSLLLPSI